jgi:NAD(P)-dependent dehydrogenase (short-subunit alcohol dehydrogenase family)
VPPGSLFDLTGKVALVTGASRGIGREIALALAGAGADVVLASRKQEGLDAVAEEIAALGGEAEGVGRALAVACHVGEAEQVAALAARTTERFGGVDVLVNNAATNPHYGPLLDADESHWDKTFDVNVKGYVRLIRACLPSMRERGGGSVVNMASIAGMGPWPGLGVYSVTKAAVIQLTRALAAELAADRVRVNALAPGLIQTRFSEALWGDESVARRLRQAIPLRRFGEASEVVGMAVYLASDASSFTTGAVLVVDGGQTAAG